MAILIMEEMDNRLISLWIELILSRIRPGGPPETNQEDEMNEHRIDKLEIMAAILHSTGDVNATPEKSVNMAILIMEEVENRFAEAEKVL